MSINSISYIYVKVTGAYSDPKSIFYIPRIKGECENEVTKIYTSLESEADTQGTWSTLVY